MHYYKKDIGKYYKKAGRLTMLQHGAYTMLMDACYDREIFPTIEQAIDWCWASSDEEIEAVKFVLSKFFTEYDGVFKQQHITETLDKYHENSATNKAIAIKREADRRTKREQSVHEPPPNKELLITNNQLITKDQKTVSKNKFSGEDNIFAIFMMGKISELNPNMKKPNLDKWSNEIRLMRQIDNREIKEIERVFVWANNDPFWQSNILSPTKLRKQFDQLSIKSKEVKPDGTNKQNHKPSLAERATEARRKFEQQDNDKPMGANDTYLRT